MRHFSNTRIAITFVSPFLYSLIHAAFHVSISLAIPCPLQLPIAFSTGVHVQMRRPFPLALRIGTDIVATSRILSPLKPDGRRLNRLATRFLHPREFDDLNRRYPRWNTPESQDEPERRQTAAWLAGRWAAKEAAKKAWDAHLIGFRDLRIETETGGGVQIVCDTTRLGPRASSPVSSTPPGSGVGRITEQAAQLSISHDGDYTIASVLASPLHHDISAELQTRKSEAEQKVSVYKRT
jgi:holo-[acyl-carrier protein] synthase